MGAPSPAEGSGERPASWESCEAAAGSGAKGGDGATGAANGALRESGPVIVRLPNTPNRLLARSSRALPELAEQRAEQSRPRLLLFGAAGEDRRQLAEGLGDL